MVFMGIFDFENNRVGIVHPAGLAVTHHIRKEM